MSNNTTLIIGAAGAIGKRLCDALSKHGRRVIASDRMEHMPGSITRSLGSDSVAVGNVDVRDKDALKDLFRKYADENTTVWNWLHHYLSRQQWIPQLLKP